MTRKEAARRLGKLADEIYYKLKDMKDILMEIAPEELERAVYWMADIDGALLNLKGWMRESFIRLEDTLTVLEEEKEGGVTSDASDN